jgi:acyl-CoA thioester hydrolase
MLMEAGGLIFTVHSADVRYLRQAKLDDELVVRTQVKGLGGASMDMGQWVYRNNNGELGDAVAELDLRIAIVNQEGRPQHIPARLKDVLERLRDKKG